MRPTRFLSLRTRVLLAIALVLLPLLAWSVVDGLHRRSERLEEVRDDNLSLAIEIARDQARLVDRTEQLLSALTVLPQVQAIRAENCSLFLASLLASYPEYANLGILDLNGDLTCSAVPSGVLNLSTERFFRRAVDTGTFSVGSYHVSPITRRATLGMGYPIQESGAPVRGVIFADLDLVWVGQRVTDSGLAEGHAAFVVDINGVVLLESTGGSKFVGTNAPQNDLVRRILERREGAAEARGLDGVTRLWSFLPLSGLPADTPVYAAVGISRSIALAPVNAAFVEDVGVLLLVWLTASGAAWIVTERSILRPIHSLANTARRLGSGDFSARTSSRPSTTELGQLGGALDAMAQSLEQQEAERRRTEQLEREKEVVERASAFKSEFLANMSHEIRTPLNAVVGMTNLLLDSPLTPQQREFTGTIRTSGEHLLTIINDILDLSKIEAGRLELERVAFPLRQPIEEAIDLVAPRAAQKNLDLAYEMVGSVPEAVHGDPGRLRQVLINLLGNAVKFTDKGEVTLTVSAERPRPDRLLLQFAVKDTGMGIAPEVQQRLFRPFTQADASITRRHGGTGLGLAISRRLVELMGGTIALASAPGQGTTVTFTIATQEAPLPVRPPGGDGVALQGKRVLVVDDNATNRTILEHQVRAWGLVPQSTGDPREALAWVRDGASFDLAVLDQRMPEMDGVELAGELRKLRSSKQLPIVVLTSLLEGRRELERTGLRVEAHLTKPAKPSVLYDTLVGALAGTARTASPQAPPQFDSQMAQRLPLRILVVEDNPVNQQVAVWTLERLGYKPDLAADGREAVERVQKASYDVVFMDLQMPEMDGLEATRRIRADATLTPQPRIVAMTAHAGVEDRQRCLAAGMDDYVSKPVNTSALLQVLSRSAPAEPTGPPSFPEASEDALDPGRWRDLWEDLSQNLSLLRRLIDSFFSVAPRLLADARQAAETRDAAALGRAAHALKSAAATVAALRLSRLCHELEAEARAGQLLEAPGRVEALAHELSRVAEALSEKRKG